MSQAENTNTNNSGRLVVWIDAEKQRLSVTPRSRWTQLTFDRELSYVLKIAELKRQGFTFV